MLSSDQCSEPQGSLKTSHPCFLKVHLEMLLPPCREKREGAGRKATLRQKPKAPELDVSSSPDPEAANDSLGALCYLQRGGEESQLYTSVMLWEGDDGHTLVLSEIEIRKLSFVKGQFFQSFP